MIKQEYIELVNQKYYTIEADETISKYSNISDMIENLKILETERKLKEKQRQNLWFDIHNATDHDFRTIQKVFGVQPITIEDFLEKFSSNESFYEFSNYISISLVIERTESAEKILNIIFSKYFILTFHGKFILLKF